jgi:glycosidase
MKRIFCFSLIGMLWAAQSAFAQIITLNPPFPSISDSITLIYDATQGSAGLKDCTDIYIHTGVITAGPNSTSWSNVPMAWGSGDPRWKLTNLGNNKFRFGFRPAPFYGIAANATVYRLGFVFRNRTGSITGKTSTGGDIFTPMYQPGQNALAFIGLESRFILGNLNQTINFTAASNFPGTLRVYSNGVEVASGPGQGQFNGSIPTNNGGTKKIVLRSDANPTLADSFTVRINQPTAIESLPAGIEDGINVLNQNSVILCLRAPFKNVVYAIGEFNNWDLTDENQMKRTPDGKFWWVQLNNLNPNQTYAFQYLVDGQLRIADPYSDIILDPFNDQFIGAAIYPGLKPYPTGKTTGNVSVFRTQETTYNWINTSFKRPAKKDLVVYELLIRDFANQKTYKMLMDTLPYLKKLGINCIQLMPVMEFEGNLSWGYNPSHHYALDKYYGTANAFKEFVDKAHGMCMAVVLDIALNHAFGQSPMVQLYWNSALNQPADNSPWFNTQPRHDFNVGYDFNHQSADTRYYVDRVMKHWLQEYKVDGFRWDLSKGFTQVNTLGNTAAWGNYDASRIAIWKNLYDDQQSYSPCSYCILEHFANNNEETELANYGMMFWGNLNYNYTEAVMGWTNTSDLGWGYYRNRNWQQPNLVTYMESHDEERLMYKSLMYGNNTQAAQGYNLRDTTTILNRIKLASTFFYPIPGPKMLWQFGEFGYGYSINFPCVNPCTTGTNRTAQKPIRWDYQNEARRKSLFDLTRALIALKRFEPVFSPENNTINMTLGNSAMKRIGLSHPSRSVVILGNFGVTGGSIVPNFQSTGMWYEFFTGAAISISNTAEPINLARGEYRMYSNQPWMSPASYLQMLNTVTCSNPPNTDPCGNPLTFIAPEISKTVAMEIFPNPAAGRFTLQMPYFHDGKASIELVDVSGKIHRTEADSFGGIVDLDLQSSGLKPGVYAIRVQISGKSYLARVILQP